MVEHPCHHDRRSPPRRHAGELAPQPTHRLGVAHEALAGCLEPQHIGGGYSLLKNFRSPRSCAAASTALILTTAALARGMPWHAP